MMVFCHVIRALEIVREQQINGACIASKKLPFVLLRRSRGKRSCIGQGVIRAASEIVRRSS
jgi:hypothetical protein